MRVITTILALLLTSCIHKHALHDLIHGKDGGVVVNVHCHCDEGKKETK